MMPQHHTILQNQAIAVTSAISQSYQDSAPSFNTVVTPSPLSWAGLLAHYSQPSDGSTMDSTFFPFLFDYQITL